MREAKSNRPRSSTVIAITAWLLAAVGNTLSAAELWIGTATT